MYFGEALGFRRKLARDGSGIGWRSHRPRLHADSRFSELSPLIGSLHAAQFR